MLLVSLIGPDIAAPEGFDHVNITGLSADSRTVEPGMLFVALSGSRTDGARFIADAVAKGAAAILASSDAQVLPTSGVPVLRTSEPRSALARMAARLFPEQPKTVVAVTGTSGKTSVAEFTRQIFAALGHKAASVGTLGVVTPDGAEYGALTTPDPVLLHKTLTGLAGAGITHLAFEASSHGLDQHRLDGVRLAAGAFTNLGRDHLDYHASLDAYFAAKLRLFEELLTPGQTAVINADDAASAHVTAVAEKRGLRILSVGREGRNVRLVRAAPRGFAQLLTIDAYGTKLEVGLPLLGGYQASNALVASGLAIAAGEEPRATIETLATLTGVKGRLEIVGEARGALAVVDYAHKPEALAVALDALRPFATNRLICVLGCGGDRDAGKRPIMGRIAAEKADVVIVTDDNPRTERPEAIRAQILAEAEGAREIAGRSEAIAAAVTILQPGDVLVVAGKGHETGQIVGNSVLPFSDQDEVRKALEKLN